MHHECLNHDVLLRVYEQLGTDRPHLREQPSVKEEKADERPTRPLSPTEPGDKETQPTIDVRAAEPQDNVHVKRAEEGTPRPTETPTPAPPPSAPDSVAKTTSAKKGRKRKSADYKPYQGLFTATLKMNEGPSV